MTQNITVTNQVEYYTYSLSQALQFDYERFIIKMHKDAIERGEAVEYHTERLKEIKESNTKLVTNMIEKSGLPESLGLNVTLNTNFTQLEEKIVTKTKAEVDRKLFNTAVAPV